MSRFHQLLFVSAVAWATLGSVALAQDPPLSQYSATTLVSNLSNPTSIAFRPDGRIYLTRKNGAILLYDPSTGQAPTVTTLPAASLREDGLHSLVLDPDFKTNRWVYVLFSEIVSGDSGIVIARYTTDSASGTLQTNTRSTLLKIPYTLASTEGAEHTTGSLAFGPDGNLYIALADNTQNIFSGIGAGYAPHDTARFRYDAQRSASNTNDLRGKILRIHPEANGTYSIPAGNLKDSINNPAFNPNWNGTEDDLAKVRPEIFVMGIRHPFRMSLDAKTGWLYWAEPGPNATKDSASLGPRGYEVVSIAKGPGNYGWPYCRANPTLIQKPATVTTPYFCYTEYNYTSPGTAGPMYNPNALRNTSKNNTGIRNLPPMKPALMWYPYDATSTLFPAFGKCTSNCNLAMVGPVYNYDPSQSASRLPSVFDRHLFVLEWVRDSLYVAPLGADGSLQSLRIFRKGRDNVMNGAIDMKIGPDGALYLLNWVNGGASGYNYPTNSGGGTLVRYAYTGTHVPVMRIPVAVGGPLRDRLFVAGPGAVLSLPEGARGAELYSLRGERLWRGVPTEGSLRQIILPASLPRGVARLRFLTR